LPSIEPRQLRGGGRSLNRMMMSTVTVTGDSLVRAVADGPACGYVGKSRLGGAL